MKKLFLVTVILLLLTAAGAAAADDDNDIFSGDLRSLTVGDTAQVTASIYNPLSIDDEICLHFRGNAIPTHLTIIDVSGNAVSGGGSCTGAYAVFVENKSQTDVNITVEAGPPGQGVLIGEVNSSTSKLANSDRLDVRVRPRFENTALSAPGITLTQLLVIGLFAGLLVFTFSARTRDE